MQSEMIRYLTKKFSNHTITEVKPVGDRTFTIHVSRTRKLLTCFLTRFVTNFTRNLRLFLLLDVVFACFYKKVSPLW